MKQEISIAICTNTKDLPEIETTYFTKGEAYRCIEITEGKEIQYLVYGVVFDKETFNKCFEDHIDTLKERVAKLPLRKDNGSMVSKTEFKNDITNVFGSNKRNTHKIVLVSSSKENIFGIISERGATKKQALDLAYAKFSDMLDNDFDSIPLGYVRWFSRGIPISLNFNSNYNGLER